MVWLQVYFVWVTGSQKHYEWFLDILRQVEEVDTQALVETHIFITQLFHMFDLRTTMLVSAKGKKGARSSKGVFAKWCYGFVQGKIN